MKMVHILLATALALTTTPAHAIQVLDSSSVVLGSFSKFKCSSGTSCSVSGGQLSLSAVPSSLTSLSLSGTLGVTGVSTLSGGVAASAGQFTNFMAWKPPTLTSGTSTTPSATVLYVSQVFIPANASITGIKLNNGATVGTNKWIVALFNSAGTPVASSALAGTLSSGADSYQTIAFTAPYVAVGPAVYWIGLYADGVTDRFRSVPAVGQYAGLAGSVSTQVFGTVAAVTLPTTFTADLGPVAFTY